MTRFLVRRLLAGVVVVWLIVTAVFALFFVSPNNVARTLAGPQASPETLALINTRLGLDRPVAEQYVTFLGRLLRGDLGFDYYHGVPVTSIVAEALPVTASLAVGAAVLWMLLGVSAGVTSSVRPRSPLDRAITAVALFCYSMPTFLIGIVLLYVLFFRLTVAGFRWFPAGGYAPLAEGAGPWLQHMILPWSTLALVLAATYARLTRATMLDTLGEDYIRTARSKGLPESRVVLRHGLRASATPVVTQFGIDFGQLVGGVVITETVFSLPGLGRTAIDAITQQNLPVIIGIVLVAAVAVVLANIAVDAVYVVIDPRVRLQ
jgi:peptide/nickel transport system permease protein